jgi:hypothetical protein
MIDGEIDLPEEAGGGGREAVFAGVAGGCRVGVERMALRAGEGGEMGTGEGEEEEEEVDEMGVGIEDMEDREEVGEMF